MARARYPGQTAGDEKRFVLAATSDHYTDNEIVEGGHVKKVRGFVRAGAWAKVDSFIRQMQADGWSASRRASVISCAMNGVRLPR
ncbi:MAG: hypothetical protein CMB80_00975 [Flammeovirgaceae bacterium]|nr:hypothetical protein [Flammeovirgaceae bacterium]|tara:strand:- start:1054 stop:1308 length:255 start_codon:yes stop_codon:yes gene_type:complete